MDICTSSRQAWQAWQAWVTDVSRVSYFCLGWDHRRNMANKRQLSLLSGFIIGASQACEPEKPARPGHTGESLPSPAVVAVILLSYLCWVRIPEPGQKGQAGRSHLPSQLILSIPDCGSRGSPPSSLAQLLSAPFPPAALFSCPPRVEALAFGGLC